MVYWIGHAVLGTALKFNELVHYDFATEVALFVLFFVLLFIAMVIEDGSFKRCATVLFVFDVLLMVCGLPQIFGDILLLGLALLPAGAALS